MDGAKTLSAEAVAIVVTVAETTQSQKYTFEGKMKDGPISKLIITKTGY